MGLVEAEFKQTEVGLIPADWEVDIFNTVKIDIVDNRGKTPSYNNNSDVELIETNAISFCIKNPDYQKITKYVTSFTYKNWFRGHPEKNDILISTVGEYSGASAIMKYSRGTIAQNLIAVKIDTNNFDSNYVFYWTRSKLYTSELAKVMMNQAQPSLRVPWLLKFKILLPPTKAEQTAIANALSDTDGYIESLEKLIAKKQKIKQGAMQQLLKPKPHWEEKKLGDVGKCHRGVSYNPEKDLHPHDKSITVRLLRSNNIQNRSLDFDELQFVNCERVKSNQILEENDIVICMANGSKHLVGKSAIFSVKDNLKYTFGAFMSCFRTEKSFAYSDFIAAIFQSYQYRNYIDVLLSGSSINNLNPSNIESINIPFPTPEEQTHIANILSDMDREITILTKKLTKAKVIKQGMMQQLLTGKIRLV